MSKTCVSIAANSQRSLKEVIDLALKKADLVEIRFDYTSKSEIDKAIEIASSIKDRAIFTCRRKDEGGKFEGNEEERIRILERLIEVKPMLVDIEYNTLLEHKFDADNILVSWHNFEYTPSQDELYKKMNDMMHFSKNIKIITFAKNIIDNITVLSLYNHINDEKLVAFCMGELGMASRVLSMLYGSPFTYATLDKPIAPGQLQIDHLKEAVKRIRIDEVILNRVINIIDEAIA
ncbi:MAG: 3-dehydroquinase [Candidatus Nitrosocaldaceae archaeon]|nr:MAG: 3-dehydroquinase [Candidatus Nitrosocaldaceae archaeon]